MSKKLRAYTWQVVRITVGTMLLCLVAYIYIPHMIYTISSNAVINAKSIIIRSPIEGNLIFGPPNIGTELKEGDIIAKIHNSNIDRESVEELNTDLISFSGLLEYLEKEKSNLYKLNEFLLKDMEYYKKSLEEYIFFQIKEEELRVEEIEQSLKESELELKRETDLKKKGFTSNSKYEDSLYKKIRFEKELKQAKVKVERLKVDQKRIKEGLFINFDGRREVPYQKQRMDDITMRISTINTQENEHKSRVENIKRRLSIEKKRIERLTYHEIKAPSMSVIWRSFLSPGSIVGAKNPVVEILDCSNVYVDMSVHERFFEKINPGHIAEVKVVGSKKMIKGRVVGIRGGNLSSKSASGSFVAKIPIKHHKEMQVLIKIDESELKKSKGDFCHVGRNAKVYFEGIE